MTTASPVFDAAVVGGGVMGCATALFLARGGMRVALFERRGLCQEASGRNAGTLTSLFPAPFLVPYAMRGMEMWRHPAGWLGMDAGFQAKGGMEVALSDDDAGPMRDIMTQRAEAGAPIELIGGNQARALEPAVSQRCRLAARSDIDGFVPSYRAGQALAFALRHAGVHVRTRTPVRSMAPDGGGFVLTTDDGESRAKRLVLACGAWTGVVAKGLGVALGVIARQQQGNVTERLPPLISRVMRVFGALSLKQAGDGTVLVGTTLDWLTHPDREREESDLADGVSRALRVIRLARDAVPALGKARWLRAWTGIEGYTADNLPLIGPLPGVEDAYVLGCQRSGFTTGPYMGRLLAEVILGREPERPILLPQFDPARAVGVTIDPKAMDTITAS